MGVSGNVLPLTPTLGMPVSVAAGTEPDGNEDGVQQDGSDVLWPWSDNYSLDPQPVGIPPPPALTIAVRLTGSPPPDGLGTGFSGGPTLDGPGAATEQGDAMNLLLTANATHHKTTEPRDPSLLPALTPAMGGLRSGDAASATPAASQATDAGSLGKSLDPPVGQPGWGRELGSRVLWLAKDNQQYAELRLNPPHLGPLEVRISLQPDQGTSLSFLSNHAAVRDAVAGALPQLREMLADGGFTMLDVNVSHHSAGGDSAWAAPRDGQGAHAMGAQEGAAAADKEGDGQQRLLPGQGVGLVDYFV